MLIEYDNNIVGGDVNSSGQTPSMYQMIGIPASGKSSFCKLHQWFAISLDVVKTRANEQRAIEDSLRQYSSFAIDNTNVTRKERAHYIALAKENGYKIEGYYFKSVIADCLERNSQRASKVPNVAILAKAKQLELPSYDEGFDELWYVSMNNVEFETTKWMD